MTTKKLTEALNYIKFASDILAEVAREINGVFRIKRVWHEKTLKYSWAVQEFTPESAWVTRGLFPNQREALNALARFEAQEKSD